MTTLAEEAKAIPLTFAGLAHTFEAGLDWGSDWTLVHLGPVAVRAIARPGHVLFLEIECTAQPIPETVARASRTAVDARDGFRATGTFRTARTLSAAAATALAWAEELEATGKVEG